MQFISKLFLTLLLVVGISNVAVAESGYCTGAELIMVTTATSVVDGVTVPNYQVYLKNTRSDCGNWVLNSKMWFTLAPENGPAMYATALTALSLRKKIAITSAIPNNYISGRTLRALTVEQ